MWQPRSVVFNRGRIVHDGDLDSGCAVYEEILGASERTRVERQQGNASRIAEIDDVEVLDSQGNPQAEFQTNESIKLRVRLKAKQAIRNVRLIVALNSPSLGTLASVSTRYQQVQFDLDPDVYPDGRIVTLSYSQVPLLLGAYHFNISLFGPEMTDFFHRRSGCGSFRIVGPPTDANGMGVTGILSLDHHWELD